MDRIMIVDCCGGLSSWRVINFSPSPDLKESLSSRQKKINRESLMSLNWKEIPSLSSPPLVLDNRMSFEYFPILVICSQSLHPN